MKTARIANTLFLGSLFGLVILWGYLPRLWVLDWPQLVLLGLAAASLVVWVVFSLDDLRLWLKKRSTQFGIGLAVTAIMSIVLLGTVNWLATTYNRKADVTKNQFHTLSDQTKKILGGLKETVTLRVWTTSIDRMSENLDMRRFLENYKIAGKGQLKIEIINPNEDRGGAVRDNIRRDKVIVVKSASGRESRIENFVDTKGEEMLTNAIIQALKGQKKMLCFVSGHGELALANSEAQGLSNVRTQLQNSTYEAKEISLASAEAVPADCETLVIAGPRTEAIERETKLLHAFLENGGKMIALMGPGTPAGWRKFGAAYGVTVRGDLIIDKHVQPPIAMATKNFAQDIEITRAFNKIVIFPEASTIDVAAKPKDGDTIRTFISSERDTYAKAVELRNLRDIRETSMDLKGPHPVAVLVTRPVAAKPGDAPAAPQKPAPIKPTHGWLNRLNPIADAHAQEDEAALEADEDDHDHDHGGAGAPPKDGPKEVKREMALIVFSNHNFVMNSFVTQVGNLDLFLNSVNFLMKDQDLIGIRPREVRQASLELTRENLRQVYATVLLVAGAFLVGGLRARRRKGAFVG